jgi:hypothetical protein
VVTLKPGVPETLITAIAGDINGQQIFSPYGSIIGYTLEIPWAKSQHDTDIALKMVLSYPGVQSAEINPIAHLIEIKQ